MNTEPYLVDVNSCLISSVGDLAIHRQQEIPEWFLDQLKDARIEAANAPAGNFHRIASIPVIIHEQWLRQGFDCTKEPTSATVARLKRLDLQKFLATPKAI